MSLGSMPDGQAGTGSQGQGDLWRRDEVPKAGERGATADHLPSCWDIPAPRGAPSCCPLCDQLQGVRKATGSLPWGGLSFHRGERKYGNTYREHTPGNSNARGAGKLRASTTEVGQKGRGMGQRGREGPRDVINDGILEAGDDSKSK